MIYLGVEYGTKFVLEGPNGVKAVFNDSTDADYVGDLNPESSGLDAPEMREDSNDRVESDGAIFGDFFAGKRPVVLQGTIIATSKAQRNERVGKLRAASNAKTENATLWWEDAAAGKVFVNLRRQQPLRITKGWVKEFQLAMVAADSRILGYSLSSGEKTGMTASTTGEMHPGTLTPLSWGINTGGWTTINNIKASDGVFSTITNERPQIILATNWSFALPTSATPDTLFVRAKGKAYVGGKYQFTRAYFSAKMSNGLSALEEARIHGAFVSDPAEEAIRFFTTTNQEVEPLEVHGYGAGAFVPTTEILNSSTFGVAFLFNASGVPSGALSLDNIGLSVSYVVGPEISVENKGNVAAPTKFTITGPVTNPVIINLQTGERFSYIGSVATGIKLIVDTEAFTIVEEGTGITGKINRYDKVAVGSNWIQIKPGVNKLQLAGSGAGETKFKVEYRDAWE